MQRVSSPALLVLLAFSCIAHVSAQLAATTAPTAVPAAAPASSVGLTNVTSPAAARTNVTAAFLTANITRPDTLVRRVEAGVSAPINPTGLVCTIRLAGQGLSGPVDTTSLTPATQATGLKNASISCTGDNSAIIEGGSALAAFVGNFSGRLWTCLHLKHNFTHSGYELRAHGPFMRYHRKRPHGSAPGCQANSHSRSLCLTLPSTNMCI